MAMYEVELQYVSNAHNITMLQERRHHDEN